MSDLFEVRSVTRAPYLYRYLIPVVDTSPDAARWISDVLDDERELGRREQIHLIGRRLVADTPEVLR